MKRKQNEEKVEEVGEWMKIRKAEGWDKSLNHAAY